MKKYLGAALIALLSLSALAASPADEAIAAADGLVKEGKWKSAFDLLALADSANRSPEVLARRIEIALAGYVRTEMHLSFAFTDLAPPLRPEMLRFQDGEYELVEFDPLSLSMEQEQAGVASVPALDKALGDYLFDVRRSYEGQWLMGDEELIVRGASYYARAREGGVFTAESLGNEAEFLLRMGEAAEAEPIIIKAESMEPDSLTLAYAHAIALIMLEKPAEALVYLDGVIAKTGQPEARASALSLAARAASLAGDAAKSESYIVRGESDNPEDPSFGLLRHSLAVSRKDAKAAAAAEDGLVARFGASPDLVRGLVTAYFEASIPAEALPFLERGLAAAKNEPQAASTFAFYRSVLFMEIAVDAAGYDRASSALEEARAIFAVAYPDEAEISSILDQVKEEIGKRKAGLGGK